MGLSYRGAIAVLQLAVFAPCFPLAVFLGFRHGFGRSSGWYFLIVFTLLRIIGAVLYLIDEYHPSQNLLVGALVCSLIGISPLTLLCVGLLSRVYDVGYPLIGCKADTLVCRNDFCSQRLSPMFFRVIGVISLLGLVIGIIGENKIDFSGITIQYANSYSKAATLLFLATWAALVLMFALFVLHLGSIQNGQNRLLIAVGISIPLILVRLIYSLVATLGGVRSFSSVSGNNTIYLCMDVLMEIGVVVVCTAFGLTLSVAHAPVHVDQEQIAINEVSPDGRGNAAYKRVDAAQGQNQQGRLNRQARPKRPFRGPISWLVLSAKDYIQDRRNRA